MSYFINPNMQAVSSISYHFSSAVCLGCLGKKGSRLQYWQGTFCIGELFEEPCGGAFRFHSTNIKSILTKYSIRPVKTFLLLSFNYYKGVMCWLWASTVCLPNCTSQQTTYNAKVYSLTNLPLLFLHIYILYIQPSNSVNQVYHQWLLYIWMSSYII